MANKFEKRKWPDRQSRNPTRRRLIPTDTEGVYDVEREEGEVTEVGRSFSKENMEDLEERIHVAFENLDATDIALIDSEKLFVSNTVEGAMEELFQYAAKGKSAIASAIGASASSTFDNLAANIKKNMGDKNTQISNLNAELQKRKRWYFGSFTVTQKVATKDNGKKGSVSVSCPINFGFTPSHIVAYSEKIKEPIVSTSYPTMYWETVHFVDDSYPPDGYWKAGILATSNNIVIKVWQTDGNVAPIVINAGTYKVFAIGD